MTADFSHEISVTLPVDEAFPLFTPKGEERWVPGWRPNYVWPVSGETCKDMIFTTGSGDEATVWTCLTWVPGQHRVRYLRTTPGSRVAFVEVNCRADGEWTTRVTVSYRYVALSGSGAAFIDVISPCVTFNNHAGSTKSYEYVREHDVAVNALQVILPAAEITASYAPGSVHRVTQHDGSVLLLHKVGDDYDPTNRLAAMDYLQQHQARGEVVTGLLYVDAKAVDLHEHLNTAATALNRMGAAELSPGRAALEALNQSLR